jgi:hypothetical protein
MPPLLWEKHSRSPGHIQRQRLVDAEAELARAELDQNGVVVSHAQGIKFGMIEMGQAQPTGQSQPILLTIAKTEEYRPIFLAEYCLSTKKAGQPTR